MIAPLPELWGNYRKNSKWKKPIFRNPEDPAEVIANMLFYSQRKEKRPKLKSVIEKSLSEVGTGKFNFNSGFITQEEVNKIAKHYGLPLVKEILVDAERIEDMKIDFYPIAIKGISKDVIHKSELDAVKLNIQNLDELKTQHYMSRKI